MSTRFIATLLAIILSGLFAGSAYGQYSDYMGSGYFPTNNLNRCHSGQYYSTQSQNASGRWSADTELNMYYSCSGTHIWTAGYNYGNTGWVGYAYICATNGQCNNTSAWNATYSSCTAQLNEYFLRNNSSSSIQATATHELGHCYSLYHRDDTSSVMYPTNATVTQPNTTDISLINARY